MCVVLVSVSVCLQASARGRGHQAGGVAEGGPDAVVSVPEHDEQAALIRILDGAGFSSMTAVAVGLVKRARPVERHHASADVFLLVIVVVVGRTADKLDFQGVWVDAQVSLGAQVAEGGDLTGEPLVVEHLLLEHGPVELVHSDGAHGGTAAVLAHQEPVAPGASLTDQYVPGAGDAVEVAASSPGDQQVAGASQVDPRWP